jgi:hypothetical protein
MKKYGNTKLEEEIQDVTKCRDIVREIVKFGVTDDQKLQIIRLLSLELENNIDMKRIINLVKNIQEGESSTEIISSI